MFDVEHTCGMSLSKEEVNPEVPVAVQSNIFAS